MNIRKEEKSMELDVDEKERESLERLTYYIEEGFKKGFEEEFIKKTLSINWPKDLIEYEVSEFKKRNKKG